MYIVGSLHGLIFLVVAVAVLYSDHQGYLYFKGKKETLAPALLKVLHRLVWVGLVFMILTGAILASTALEYYLTQWVFYLKMSFVLVLAINALAIGKLSMLAGTTPFKELGRKQQRQLVTSGAISFVSWIMAAVIGFFFL